MPRLRLGGTSGARSQSGLIWREKALNYCNCTRNARTHFKTNVDLLLDRTSDEILYVRDGKITRRSKRAMRGSFTECFRDARYYEWNDIEPPVVHISRDASMEWMITTVRVRRTQSASSGSTTEEFVYAGMSTYEKRDGRWMEVANVSTFEPQK